MGTYSVRNAEAIERPLLTIDRAVSAYRSLTDPTTPDLPILVTVIWAHTDVRGTNRNAFRTTSVLAAKRFLAEQLVDSPQAGDRPVSEIRIEPEWPRLSFYVHHPS